MKSLSRAINFYQMNYNLDYFQNLYDKNYKTHTFEKCDVLRAERFKRIARRVEAGSKVLDYGGGDGLLKAYLKEGCSYDILDLSNEHKLGENRVALVNGVEVASPPGVYDVAVVSDVLEHLPNPHETLTEIIKVLKNDGIIVLTVPNVFAPEFIVRSWLGKHQDPSYQHLYWFDWSYLCNLMRAVNCELVFKETFCLFNMRWYKKVFFLDRLFSRVFPNNCYQLVCVFKKQSKPLP